MYKYVFVEFVFVIICIQVKGGSGEYVWSSFKVEIIIVNNKGEIIIGNGGEVQIIAFDVKNRVYIGSVKVMFSTWIGKGIIVKI